jgi:hypothetical protein
LSSDVTNSRLRRALIYAAVALAIFLLGFVPMWLKARGAWRAQDNAQRELRVSQLENLLSSAVIDARRGDYEPARQASSDFFTRLSSQLDSGDSSDLAQSQRDAVRPLLAQRDELITLLARGDPAAADRLTNFYVAYRKAMAPAQPAS